MNLAVLIRTMRAAGVDPNVILDAVEAGIANEVEVTAVKTARQQRNARYYQARKERLNKTSEQDVRRLKTSDEQKVNDCTPLPTTLSLNLTKNSPPSGVRIVRTREAEFKSEFEQQFWPAYPHKVGKPKAFQSFSKARLRASLAEILVGLEAYKRAKPPDRQWLNPATFLNQDRWLDQPAANAPPPMKGPADGKADFKSALAKFTGREPIGHEPHAIDGEFKVLELGRRGV